MSLALFGGSDNNAAFVESYAEAIRGLLHCEFGLRTHFDARTVCQSDHLTRTRTRTYDFTKPKRLTGMKRPNVLSRNVLQPAIDGFDHGRGAALPETMGKRGRQ